MNRSVDRRAGTVVRVRVRTAGDVFGARLRATAALRDADLHPSSLPPAAILCLRWMRVPERIGAPADLSARRRFEQVLQAKIDDLARGAMRPADGPVGWCDAVVFSDLSELLACLARDWCAGLAVDRWWWRALLRARVTLDVVVQTWAESGPHIAAAFARLAATGAAAAFTSALDARQVRALAAAIADAFGAPPVGDLLAVHIPAARLSPIRDARRLASISTALAAIAGIVRADDGVPSSARFRDDQRAFMALATIVWHQPSLPRQPRFVDAFHAALDAAASTVPDDGGAIAHVGRSVGSTGTSAPCGEESSPGEAGTRGVARGARGLPRSIDSARPTKNGGDQPPVGGAIDVRDVRTGAGDGRCQESMPEPPRRAGLEAAPATSPIDTPLGGVFYLLNAAIAMRLYGDFTVPRRCRLTVSPWDFLALVAAQWLGEPLDVATEALLARLAGRETGERPGTAFYSEDRLARWVPGVARRIRARVARSLGQSADADVGRRLLCHDACVHLTAAHVDVRFALDALPIDIRLAGLDRNPGWVPAAGRIVTFHYS